MEFITEKERIAKILFFDIETVRAWPKFDDMPEGLRKLWTLKAERIEKDTHLSPEEKYEERAGIYAEFGKVVCISFGLITWKNDQAQIKLKSIYGDDEREVLLTFRSLLDDKLQKYNLCAHNGREFDVPFLGRRYIIHQIQPPKLLEVRGKKPWENTHILDTMELWKFGDYKSYTKLELLCEVLQVPSPKDEMEGSQVNEVYWGEHNLTKIAEYCEKDVLATAEVYLKFALLPGIKLVNR